MWIIVFVVILLSLNESLGDDNYLLALPRSDSDIDGAAGETGGWYQVWYPSLNEYAENTTLGPIGFTYVNVPDTMIVSFGIENKSIVVAASETVSIYGFNSFYFTPLPIQALAKRYIVASCHGFEYTSVLIIASHSLKATVEITFRLDGNVTFDDKMYSNGDTISMNLEEYQTVTIKSEYDLSGTVINSTESVAVFSGIIFSDSVVAYDQLLPVKHHKQQYVVAVDDNIALYKMQIISEHSDTQITFNNGTSVDMDERNIHQQMFARNESIAFTSTRPVLTTLCRQNGHNSGFLVVPGFELGIDQASFYQFADVVLKMFIEKDNVNSSYFLSQTNWNYIQGSCFAVGTRISTRPIISNNSFVVLVFRSSFIYNGGYKFTEENNHTVTRESNSESAPLETSMVSVVSYYSQVSTAMTNMDSTLLPTNLEYTMSTWVIAEQSSQENSLEYTTFLLPNTLTSSTIMVDADQSSLETSLNYETSIAPFTLTDVATPDNTTYAESSKVTDAELSLIATASENTSIASSTFADAERSLIATALENTSIASSTVTDAELSLIATALGDTFIESSTVTDAELSLVETALEKTFIESSTVTDAELSLLATTLEKTFIEPSTVTDAELSLVATTLENTFIESSTVTDTELSLIATTQENTFIESSTATDVTTQEYRTLSTNPSIIATPTELFSLTSSSQGTTSISTEPTTTYNFLLSSTDKTETNTLFDVSSVVDGNGVYYIMDSWDTGITSIQAYKIATSPQASQILLNKIKLYCHSCMYFELTLL